MLASMRHSSSSRCLVSLDRMGTRLFGSISKINCKILRNFALTKNPSALKTELLRVAKEGKGFSDTVSLPKITAQFCVNKKHVEFDLAFEILGCLEEAKPKTMLLGLFELVDKCIECGHIDDAMKGYLKLKDIDEKLDVSGKQRLLSVLAFECRICDIMTIANDHSMTDGDLVIIAEPLIMTGNMKQFNSLLQKFLSDKSNLTNEQRSERIARVLRSVIYARMRRHIQQGELTPHEKNGVKELFKMLQNYHSKVDTDGIAGSPSYFQTCQLFEMEKERLGPNELSVFDFSLSEEECRATNRLPKFEVTSFPYVVEGDDEQHLNYIDSKKIKDLSSQLKKKDPSRVLLYRSTIFPDSYEIEMKLLREKNMERFSERIFMHEHMSYSLIGAVSDSVVEDSDSDSDSDNEGGYDSMETQFDEEEFDESGDDDSDDDSDSDYESDTELLSLFTEYTRLKEASFARTNRTVRTLLPPSFKVNDITQTLEKKNPSIYLEFSEDIFDFGQEPTAWPRIIMPGGFILHKNEKKDPSVKN